MNWTFHLDPAPRPGWYQMALDQTKLQDRLESALAEAAEDATPFDPAAERPPHY